MNNYVRPLSPNELYHHGIMGMKWGVRRYQNADGSYTSAGRERYGKAVDTAFKPGKDGKASNAEKIARSSNDIVNEVKKTRDNNSKRKSDRKYSDLSKLSDSELNKLIDRMTKEKRYRDLKYDLDEIQSGKIKVGEILDTIGTLTAIGASTASIATAIYAIKKATH